MVADELRRQADCFVELERLKSKICRESGSRQGEREYDVDDDDGVVDDTETWRETA